MSRAGWPAVRRPTERSANHASASTRHAADTVLASARRDADRPCTNGATAMRRHASRRPTTPPRPRLDGARARRRRARSRTRRSSLQTTRKPRAEQEVEPATLDGEADRLRAARRSPRRGHDRARARAAAVAGRSYVCELVIRDEERQRGAEQAEKEDLSPEPGLVIVSAVLPHVHSFGRTSSADKRCTVMAERILLVDDHPLTRDALAALLEPARLRRGGRGQ